MVFVLPIIVVLSNTLRPRMATTRDPSLLGMHFDDVTFQTFDGKNIKAWWIGAPAASARTMLVCHGVGANRDDALRFFRMLHDAGFNILCWDWRGHGNSDWAQVTFGLREKRDVRGAVDWVLKNRAAQATWLGAFGISMGAGILVQAGPLCPEIRAFVLDSPFASVGTMLPFMMRTLPGWLAKIVCAATELAAFVVVGATVDEIAPVNAIKDIHVPVFISHGTADRVIPYQQSEQLAAAANEPKELWIERDIGHTELREYQTDRYHERVQGFLKKVVEGGFATPGAPASAR